MLHPVLCAAGYSLRWLMKAIARLWLKALLGLWLLIGILGRVSVTKFPGRQEGGWKRKIEYSRADYCLRFERNAGWQ